MRRTSIWLGVASVALGIALAAVPQDLLTIVVGDQAGGVAKYVLPSAMSLAASGLITGSNIGLRALSATGRLITARLVTSLLTVGGGLVGFAVTSSALGALWGLAIGAFLGVPVWEVHLARAVRTHRTAASPAVAAAGD
jgi:hypothetical protein